MRFFIAADTAEECSVAFPMHRDNQNTDKRVTETQLMGAGLDGRHQYFADPDDQQRRQEPQTCTNQSGVSTTLRRLRF